MFGMVGGLIRNIVVDFMFVWIYEMGMKGGGRGRIGGEGVSGGIGMI